MSAVPVAQPTTAPLLDVRRLSVEFGPPEAPLPAASDVSFSVHAGEVLGIVGESGSGKSVTALSVLGLIDAPGDRKSVV